MCSYSCLDNFPLLILATQDNSPPVMFAPQTMPLPPFFHSGHPQSFSHPGRFCSRHFYPSVICLSGIRSYFNMTTIHLSAGIRNVPDSIGTHFLFSTPLCDPDNPAVLHVIPQTTETVTMTLVHQAPEVHTIASDSSLSLQLTCSVFVWGQTNQTGTVKQTKPCL